MYLGPLLVPRRPGSLPGRPFSLLVAALVAVACRTAPPGSGESRIVVEASSEELRRQVATVAAHILPELEAELGVSAGDLRIVVDTASPAEERGGSTSSQGITLFSRAIPWLPGALAHEAVHWLVHWRDTYWNTLPIVVEEGLAMLAFHAYSNTEVPPDVPGELELAAALRLSHEEYNEIGRASGRERVSHTV